jgi:predicted Zn-dependent protease
VNPAEGSKTAIPEITLLRAYSEVTVKDPKYQQRYLELLDRLAQFQPKAPFVQAALGHKLLAEGKAQEALPHLSLGMPLDEVAIYEDMAKALSALGRDEAALTCLKQASAAYPFDAVLMKMLVLQYIKLKHFAEAREEMQRYVGLFPEDPFMRGLLARVTN